MSTWWRIRPYPSSLHSWEHSALLPQNPAESLSGTQRWARSVSITVGPGVMTADAPLELCEGQGGSDFFPVWCRVCSEIRVHPEQGVGPGSPVEHSKTEPASQGPKVKARTGLEAQETLLPQCFPAPDERYGVQELVRNHGKSTGELWAASLPGVSSPPP